MTFNCVGCGICCTKVGLAFANRDKLSEGDRKALDEFPYKADSSGTCEMLVENKCMVYEDRPLLCRVGKMHKKFYADKISKVDYFNFVGSICNTWIAEKGGDKFVKQH